MRSFRARSARRTGWHSDQQPIHPGHQCRATQSPRHLQSHIRLGAHQYVNGDCFAAPTAVGQNGPTLLPVAYGPAYFNSDLALFKNFRMSESKNLQFRIQSYNFLNHPLWSFPNNNNLTLQFQQDASGTSLRPMTSSAKPPKSKALAWLSSLSGSSSKTTLYFKLEWDGSGHPIFFL